MQKFVTVSAVLLFVLVAFSVSAQTNYYISPTGDDSNSGTSQASPYATLEKARDQIRTTSPSDAVTVWLMDGDYYLDSTFDLTSLDSGTASNRTTYRAVNKHAAKLHLTKRIPVSDLESITDPAILARVNSAATGQVKALDLAALGVQNMDTWPDYFPAANQSLFRIYADDDAMQLSRYPNDSTMMMKRVLQNEPGIFEYRNNRTADWLDAVNDGLWLQGYWRVAWQYDAVKTTSIDVANKTITQAASVPLGIGSKYQRPEGSGVEPYIAINLLEEIDLPGEWSVNFNTDILYIWVPSGTSELKILDKEEAIFELQSVDYVDIIDIKFDYSLGNAIKIVNGYDNKVAGCDITHCIQDAVVVQDGSSHDIVSNDIHHLGAGGISLSGGDRSTLTEAGHTAVNNHIYEFGEVTPIYEGAIEIPGKHEENNVGMYVAHNKIHGTPHVGVEFCGNNNIFEYNEVYDICRVSNDMAAFYSWNDWSSYGNVFRYNYVHDAEQAHGVYLDDGDSGETIYNNIFQHIDVGIFIGGGHDIIATNNLAIDCEKTVHVDNRGVSRGYNLDNSGMVNRVLSVPYQSAPWSTQYPMITTILDENYPQELPEGCEIDCNVAINTGTVVDITATQATDWGVTLGTNYSDTDATLTDADLSEIAAATGYAGESCIGTIDVAQIGLITDEYRTVAVLPVSWLNFDARKSGKNVQLDWKVANERNNSGFEVQRSKRNSFTGQYMNWESIGFVAGRGDTERTTAYDFTDTNPYNGINTYRLKQIDLDGKSSYSPVKTVEFTDLSELVQVFPNPTRNQLTVRMTDNSAPTSLLLFDKIGRQTAVQFSANGTADVSQLAAGIYFLEVKVNGQILREKIVVL